MPDVTWDGTFEASPADTDEAKYGATKIRQLKLAISERGELEFNWKDGTQPFVKAGKAAVVFIGTTTEINALTGMAAGAFAWDTTLKVLKRYSGSAWVILDIDHGQLSGLADDDHPQYLKLTKAGQELTQNLAVTALKTIDGRDLSVDGTKLDGILTNQVSILTGTITHGGTIPLPDGFIQAQCKWIVTAHTWSSGHGSVFGLHCYADANRVVTIIQITSTGTFYDGTASYMIIGVK